MTLIPEWCACTTQADRRRGRSDCAVLSYRSQGPRGLDCQGGTPYRTRTLWTMRHAPRGLRGPSCAADWTTCCGLPKGHVWERRTHDSNVPDCQTRCVALRPGCPGYINPSPDLLGSSSQLPSIAIYIHLPTLTHLALSSIKLSSCTTPYHYLHHTTA